MKRLSVFEICVFFALGMNSAGAQDLSFSSEPVTVFLASEAVVDDTLITLDQVAKLRGGSELLRRRLEKLDVAEFKLSEAHHAITAEQVRFRIMIAGIETNRFRLEGAKRTFIMERDE